MFTSKLSSTFLNSLKNATKLTTRILGTSLTLKRIHILLLADIINLNRFINFRSPLLNSFQAYETGKLKEAGALILKARQLLDASEPKRETTKTLHSTISSQVQSSSSSIQAALVLPATQSTKKGRKDLESFLQTYFRQLIRQGKRAQESRRFRCSIWND